MCVLEMNVGVDLRIRKGSLSAKDDVLRQLGLKGGMFAGSRSLGSSLVRRKQGTGENSVKIAAPTSEVTSICMSGVQLDLIENGVLLYRVLCPSFGCSCAIISLGCMY